jgi:putative flippase GtrA
LLGLHPFVARIAAIMVAMTSGWLCHRTFTFALKTPPTVAEFLRYVAVGWFVSAINYGLFVIILLVRPSTEPLVALLGSSVVAMVFAYFGMRVAAFKVGGADPHPLACSPFAEQCYAERSDLALTSSRRRERPQGGRGSRPGPNRRSLLP